MVRMLEAYAKDQIAQQILEGAFFCLQARGQLIHQKRELSTWNAL